MTRFRDDPGQAGAENSVFVVTTATREEADAVGWMVPAPGVLCRLTYLVNVVPTYIVIGIDEEDVKTINAATDANLERLWFTMVGRGMKPQKITVQ